MMRSLYSGVSGLRNHQTRMDVVGNNIANVNTVGYKAARTIFQDLYSQNLRTASAPGSTTGGTNPTQVGLGVTLQSIDNLFTTSAAQVTGNTYDLMIQNDGFFVVRNGTQEFYTRAGNFYFDKANYLVTANGDYLMGFQALVTEGTEAVAAEPSAIEYVVSDMVERVDERKVVANRQSIDVSAMNGVFNNTTIEFAVVNGDLVGQVDGVTKYSVSASGNKMTLTDLNNSKNKVTITLDYKFENLNQSEFEGKELKFGLEGQVDIAASLFDADFTHKAVSGAGSIYYGNSKLSKVADLADATLTIGDDGLGGFTVVSTGATDNYIYTAKMVNKNLVISSADLAYDITINLDAYSDSCLDGKAMVFDQDGFLITDAAESTLLNSPADVAVVTNAIDVDPSSTYKTIKLKDNNGLISCDEWNCALDRGNMTLTLEHKANPNNTITITLEEYQSGCLNNATIAFNDNQVSIDRANSSILTATVDVPNNYYIFGAEDRTDAPTSAELMDYVTIGLPGAKREATYSIIDDPNKDTLTVIETDRYGNSVPLQIARPRESNNYIVSVPSFGLEIQVNANYQAGDLNGFAVEMDGTGVEAIAKGSPISVFSNAADNMGKIYVDPLLYNVTIDDKGIVSGLAERDGIITCPTTGQQIYVLADQRVEIGQVVVATFENQQALEKVGDNLYRVTTNTGDPAYNKSGVNGAGTIKPGTLEMSNVDLSQEFTDMIVTQRGFQANSRVITVSDTLLEELINLKR